MDKIYKVATTKSEIHTIDSTLSKPNVTSSKIIVIL